MIKIIRNWSDYMDGFYFPKTSQFSSFCDTKCQQDRFIIEPFLINERISFDLVSLDFFDVSYLDIVSGGGNCSRKI